LSLLKGIPLAYNRDLQEDKLYLFRAVERILGSLSGMTHLLGALRFDKEKMHKAASGSATWATDLAERLVARGAPFREAHESVGGLVADVERSGSSLSAGGADLSTHHPLLEAADAEVGDPLVGLRARSSPGGTSPERVADQAEALRSEAKSLGDLRR
jgi:argininosuccinate lyase